MPIPSELDYYQVSWYCGATGLFPVVTHQCSIGIEALQVQRVSELKRKLLWYFELLCAGVYRISGKSYVYNYIHYTTKLYSVMRAYLESSAKVALPSVKKD